MRKASNAYKRGKDAEWQAAKAAGFRAKRDYKKINHDKFGSSIIAGGFSSAYRAATSKDGKLFSGAASGIKGSVDARDLRDKRKDADYGFVTRKLDEMRDFAGIDTAAKGRANELHDRINQMNAVLGTYQSQLNSYATQLSSTQINDIMKNPDNYLSDADVNISGYASMLKAYSKQQTAITKEQKKLEKLYESSKK